MSLVTGLFFPAIFLNQQWSPPLRLQASHCSTFRIMCNVPSIAVFCGESIERFPGTASKFFLKLLVTIPVAPIITGIIVHFRFHISCISIHKLLCFNFFSASFCTIIIISIIIIILVIASTHGIYNYIPETNHVATAHTVAAVLYLQSVLQLMLFLPWNMFCTVTSSLPAIWVQCLIRLYIAVP